jgi:hypothetical protein
MEKPSIGRIVHYVAYGTPGGEFPAGACRAAVITEIGVGVASTGGPDPDERVGVMVANPSGLYFNHGIAHDEDKAPGTWHWPERL